MSAEQKPFPVAVIEAVLAAGVQEFVICAGARNSALIVVLAALGDKVRLWQHFDERAAGFFALGRIRATERPVAVVTTSGTAAAELLPAVIEAHYQGLPLVALTADRPKHFRGSGAPQAIEQENLFSPFTITSHDLEESLPEMTYISFRDFNFGARVGPVHLNVCLPEPEALELLRTAAEELAPPSFWAGMSCFLESVEGEVPVVSAHRAAIAADILPGEVAGAAAFVPLSGGLLYAEASSGLRNHPSLQDRLLRCGEATLRHLPVECVMRIGGVPSLRYWRDLEESKSVVVVHQSRTGLSGLARKERVQSFADCAFAALSGNRHPLFSRSVVFVDDYLARDAALYARLGELLLAFPNSEPALFRRLSQVIPNNAAVFTGNSMPVREWNLCAEYGRGHRVHVLRGANGIDGNVSAFLGIAADEPEAWCLTGDLTTLYDLNAPWMLPQLSAGKRRFVVIQNVGGKIFSRLPSLKSLTERERALMENPHTISLRGWAEMWGMDHARGGGEVLDRASALADHAVIELHPDAAETDAFWKAWAAAEAEVWGNT